ncbi:hypothetical protein ACWDAQ_28365, partial [Streptomyces sp. NPDC001139]
CGHRAGGHQQRGRLVGGQPQRLGDGLTAEGPPNEDVGLDPYGTYGDGEFAPPGAFVPPPPAPPTRVPPAPTSRMEGPR